ncbi:MAG: tetratricopeptide repeat protein [Bacteroidales bacterium]|nr:tetratricopeptide repeat protein [Bacteroidales bacterium]
MTKKLTIVLVLASFLIIACNSAKREQNKAIKEIQSLESELIADSISIINQKKAKQLIDLYNIYSSNYKTDSLAPEYLFKAGELAMNLNYSTQAIVYLNRFEKDFNSHDKMPYCIFFQAFIYENQLNNLEKAEQYYQRFIDKYPNHELADDAATSIKHLGKSLEEIIQSFEEQRKAENNK